jgi:hypothetical protein
MPDPAGRDRRVIVRVLTNGSALLVIDDESFVLGGGGVRRRFVGSASDLVTIDKKTVAVSGAIALRDLAAPNAVTYWALNAEDSSPFASGRRPAGKR